MMPTTKAKQRTILDGVIRSLKRSPSATWIQLEITVLECILQHLHNRQLNPRRPATSVTVTPQVEHQIIADFNSTSLTQHQIAVKNHVNQGRVNNVVNGVLQ